uniref:Uncharacterized protein n=1 Tax=Romanomermis culicivorax TaxID=13658 RepID=A0A915J898_ROMCU
MVNKQSISRRINLVFLEKSKYSQAVFDRPVFVTSAQSGQKASRIRSQNWYKLLNSSFIIQNRFDSCCLNQIYQKRLLLVSLFVGGD